MNKFRIVEVIKKQRRFFGNLPKKQLRTYILLRMYFQIHCYPVTAKTMCEHIVKAGFQWQDGSTPTAEEIFKYSPSGELSMLFQWYEEACLSIGPPEKKP